MMLLAQQFITLFETGTFWWWALLAVVSVGVIASIENERLEFATICVIVAGLVIVFLSDAWSYLAVWADPWRIATGVIVYIGLGVAWGVTRWCWLVYQRKRMYYRLRREWLEAEAEEEWTEGGVPVEVPESLRGKWAEYINKFPEFKGSRTYPANTGLQGKPNPKVVPSPLTPENRTLIAGWMAYWPWSIFWQIVRLLCERIWIWLVDQIKALLGKLTAIIFPEPGDIQ